VTALRQSSKLVQLVFNHFSPAFGTLYSQNKNDLPVFSDFPKNMRLTALFFLSGDLSFLSPAV